MLRTQVLSLFLILSFMSTAFSQNKDNISQKESVFSSNLKLGGYNLFRDDLGTLKGLDFNFFRNGGVYSCSYNFYKEFDILSANLEEFNDCSLLIGFYTQNKSVVFTHQFGISYLWGTIHEYSSVTDYLGRVTQIDKMKNVYTFGLELLFGFKYLFTPELTFGLEFQANINREKIIAMPMITIGYGNLQKLF